MNAARTVPNNVVALFSRTKDNRGSLVNFTDLLALVVDVSDRNGCPLLGMFTLLSVKDTVGMISSC